MLFVTNIIKQDEKTFIEIPEQFVEDLGLEQDAPITIVSSESEDYDRIRAITIVRIN